MGAGLRVEALRKRFGETLAVDSVSFEVNPGEIVALLGPSGCGKSTVLHLIAGLLPPDRGHLWWDDQRLDGVAPHLRQFGLMFQELALFPHMDVARNVAFGLRMRQLPPDAIAERIQQVLTLVGLPGLGQRQVDQLSGGQRQRVALARSLAPSPRLLMLDEPLAALDRTLKERLMLELPGILRTSQQTVVYVTHDQEEAFAVADRVVIMQAGGVAQIGTPRQLYQSPASAFVARFLGLENLLPAQLSRSPDGWQAETELGSLPLAGEQQPGQATLLLRPDRAQLDGRPGIEIRGRLTALSFRGSSQHIKLETETGLALTFELGSAVDLPAVGQPLTLTLDPAAGLQVLP